MDARNDVFRAVCTWMHKKKTTTTTTNKTHKTRRPWASDTFLSPTDTCTAVKEPRLSHDSSRHFTDLLKMREKKEGICSSWKRLNMLLPLPSRALWRKIMGKYSKFFFTSSKYFLTGVGHTLYNIEHFSWQMTHISHSKIYLLASTKRRNYVFGFCICDIFAQIIFVFFFLFVCLCCFWWISFGPFDNKEFKQRQR